MKENEGGNLPASYSFVQADKENVVIEAVKKAEDSDAVIVRLYECYNRRGQTTLTFPRPVKRASDLQYAGRRDRRSSERKWQSGRA